MPEILLPALNLESFIRNLSARKGPKVIDLGMEDSETPTKTGTELGRDGVVIFRRRKIPHEFELGEITDKSFESVVVCTSKHEELVREAIHSQEQEEKLTQG